MGKNNKLGININVLKHVHERIKQVRFETPQEKTPDELQRFILDTLDELGITEPFYLSKPRIRDKKFIRSGLIEILTGTSKSVNFKPKPNKMLMLKDIGIEPEDKFTFDNLQIEFLIGNKKRVLDFSGGKGITEGFTRQDNIFLDEEISGIEALEIKFINPATSLGSCFVSFDIKAWEIA